MSIAKLVPSPITDEKHADAVLEVAFLMSAVDGYLADQELAAFRELLPLLRGRAANEGEVDALLGRFLTGIHASGAEARLREVAAAVPVDLREAAFKVAVGLSLVDDDADQSEYELVALLASALGVKDRAVALAADARAALGA